ncbi:hypothetical protein [Pelagibius sp. Alg239-R121]|uniref:hypothetical protein n=1 Tax=Pelagibius sp. Alg239-R121 TaxID=2993448 RepID=UPI0024A77034|nr:hypothetical protein [Pelagibius sp. Alg239-R121]
MIEEIDENLSLCESLVRLVICACERADENGGNRRDNTAVMTVCDHLEKLIEQTRIALDEEAVAASKTSTEAG